MKDFFDTIDRRIAESMNRIGLPALRLSLGIIFFWFGILKTIGLSPAEGLVLSTVDWMPIFSAEIWLVIIGWWEVIIGICFLFKPTIRIAIGLLAMQMAGTLLPLFILTEVTFQAGNIPYAPTMEGQYIIKNLLIISAAIVIGGTVRKN